MAALPASKHSGMSQDEIVLHYRVREAYKSLTSRAHHILPFTEEQLRRKINIAIKNSFCRYCRVGIQPQNFSLDHNIPSSRGGSHTLDNLDVICRHCNLAKWDLTGLEFSMVCMTLRELGIKATNSIIDRLRLAGNEMLKQGMSSQQLASREKYKYIRRRTLNK